MCSIDDFIVELTQIKNTSTFKNPYLDSSIANNLRIYLNAITKMKGKRILLVGEAPGYKGCKLTGIPFTSGAVFERFDHPLLNEIGNQLTLSKVESENTATIIWEYLSKNSFTPLFWNSFPFHPHFEGDENTNRAPTANEIDIGFIFLNKLVSIYQPEVIAGIGHNGVNSVKKVFPEKEVVYIRHPSFGGKTDFIMGMDKIISNYQMPFFYKKEPLY